MLNQWRASSQWVVSRCSPSSPGEGSSTTADRDVVVPSLQLLAALSRSRRPVNRVIHAEECAMRFGRLSARRKGLAA